MRQIADDILKCIQNEKKKCHIAQKTLREKEILLVTSKWTLSHNVFHSYIYFVRQNAALCGTCNGLCGKAASSFERILCEVLVKRAPGNH